MNEEERKEHIYRLRTSAEEWRQEAMLWKSKHDSYHCTKLAEELEAQADELEALPRGALNRPATWRLAPRDFIAEQAEAAKALQEAGQNAAEEGGEQEPKPPRPFADSVARLQDRRRA